MWWVEVVWKWVVVYCNNDDGRLANCNAHMCEQPNGLCNELELCAFTLPANVCGDVQRGRMIC